MFRIAQEALANVERHSRATALPGAVVVRGDRRMLEVRDDGRGFASGQRRAPRQLRHPRHAGAGRQHRRHPRRRQHRGRRHHHPLPPPASPRPPPERPVTCRSMPVRLLLADDHPMLARRPAPLAHRGGLRGRGRGLRRLRGHRPGRRAAARGRADGRHHAQLRRGRGDPPHPGQPPRRAGRDADHARRQGRPPAGARGRGVGLPGEGLLARRDRRGHHHGRRRATDLSPSLAASMLGRGAPARRARHRGCRAGRHQARGGGAPAHRRRVQHRARWPSASTSARRRSRTTWPRSTRSSMPGTAPRPCSRPCGWASSTWARACTPRRRRRWPRRCPSGRRSLDAVAAAAAEIAEGAEAHQGDEGQEEGTLLDRGWRPGRRGRGGDRVGAGCPS